MPWTEPVDQRFDFVTECLEGKRPVSTLCDLYGVSRKTGYKWLKRFKEGGRAALEDRPRTPHSSPNAISDEVKQAVLALRRIYPTWGPKKICARLPVTSPTVQVPARSTVARILNAAGLADGAISARRRRAVKQLRVKKKLASSDAPNVVWGLDFKGDFRLGDRSRCYPLTITDNCTRYLIACCALESTHLKGVQEVLLRTFRRYGLPRYMRSDNGAPFGSEGVLGLSALSVWLLRHGVEPEHIQPGRPDQNGRHERMHRPLKTETTQPPKKTRKQQQRRFDRFRRYYNEERPHEGIGLVTPASLYSASNRRLTTPRSPSYPGHYEVFKVKPKGHFRWKKVDVFVGSAFRGEPVGLNKIDEALWLVSYGSRELGLLDERLMSDRSWIKIRPLPRPANGGGEPVES